MRHSSTGRHPVTGEHAPQEADLVRAALSMVLRKKRAQQAGAANSDGVVHRREPPVLHDELQRQRTAEAEQPKHSHVHPYEFEEMADVDDCPQLVVRSKDQPRRAARRESDQRSNASSSDQVRGNRRTARSRLDGAHSRSSGRDGAPATHWEHTRAAFGDGLRSFRRFALFLTAIAAVLMVALFLGRQLIHEQIRKTLVERFNTHYADSGLRIEIGAVRFQEGAGFHVSGVRVVNLDTSARDTSNDVLVSIERVMIHAKASIWDLFKDNISPELIEVDGMRAYAHRDAQGEWNVAKLFPLPSLSDDPAPLRLTNGQVVVEAEGTNQLRKPLRVALADLRIDTQWEDVLDEVKTSSRSNKSNRVETITPVVYQDQPLRIPTLHREPADQLSQTIEIPDDEPVSESASAENTNAASRDRPAKQKTSIPKQFASKRLKFRVSFATERISHAAFEGIVNFKLGTWHVHVQGEQVVLDDEYLELVPPELATELATLQSFDGELNVKGAAQGSLSMKELPRFRFEGDVQKGRLSDKRLPYPLDNVQAQFAVDNTTFHLRDVTAQFGTGRVAVSCDGGWLGSGSKPLSVRVSGERIRLDDSVTDSVPPSLRKIWDDFSPVGLVNVDVRLTHVDGKWQPDLTMELIDLSIEPRGFPYRVDGCHGVVTWNDGVSTIDFKGLASGRMATFKGTIYDDPNRPTQIDVDLPRPIPIDEKLFQALEVRPNLQETIRSFHPTGMMTCHAVLRRSPINQKIRLDALEVVASDGSILFDKVPYPVNGISGRIVFQNGITSFQEFRGQNDGGTIFLDGTIDSVGRLNLKFTGSAIQMEEELRLALPVGLQQLWLNLRPRGAIDYVQLQVASAPHVKGLSIDVQAVKNKQHRGLTQSLSLQPVWFPQRLSDVTGTFDYRDGKVTIREFEAYSGSALVSTEGHGEVTPYGWKTTFENLSVDALVMDESFLQAMPQALAKALRKLELAGPINVFGKLVLSTGEQRTTPIDAGLGQVWGQDRESRPLPLGGLQLPGDTSPARDLVVDWDIRLDLDGGSMKLSKPIEHIFGGVRLIGRQDESGTHQVGYIDVDSLVVDDVQLTQVRGPIRIEPTYVAVGRRAELAQRGTAPQPLRAELFDGRINLDGRLNLDERGDFVVNSFFENGDLTRVAAELAPRLSSIRGRANGALELSGNALGPESYSGRGYLRLRDAQIYEIPLVLSLLKVLSIKQPDKTAFTECNFDFTIADEHFTFSPIELKGDAITLKGNGEIAFDRELNMMFYAMVGRDDVKIPVISRLAGAASQSAWQVEVDGTLQEPVLKQHPFPVLNDTLQQIFPEVPVDSTYNRNPKPSDAYRSATR